MTASDDTISAFLPLPPTTFHILLALTDNELHGYAIMQDVATNTGGALKLSAGTLYRTVARLLEQGLIAESRARRPAGDDERRRYYSITRLGTAVARAEMRRLNDLVRLARASGLKPAPA